MISGDPCILHDLKTLLLFQSIYIPRQLCYSLTKFTFVLKIQKIIKKSIALLNFFFLFSNSDCKRQTYLKVCFFNCYLAAPQPMLGHSQGGNLTNPILITVFLSILNLRSPRSSERGWVLKPS